MLFFKNGNEMERAYHNQGGKFWFYIEEASYIVAANNEEEAIEHLKTNINNFIKANALVLDVQCRYVQVRKEPKVASVYSEDKGRDHPFEYCVVVRCNNRDIDPIFDICPKNSDLVDEFVIGWLWGRRSKKK